VPDSIGEDPLLKRKHLSIHQTAELMGVSTKTVYNWIKKHKIEWFRTPSGRIRVFVDSLGKFTEADEIFHR
jgi:excisionase family DNA binding protein